MRPGIFDRRWGWLLAVAVVCTASCFRQLSQRSLEETIIAAARQHPAHAAKWDETIRDLAHRYVEQARSGHLDAEKGRRARQAVEQGCRDPFVRYLWLIHQDVPGGMKPGLLFPEAKAVAEELEATGYPPYVRAMAADFSLQMTDDAPTPADEAARQPLHDIQWKSSFGGIHDPAVSEWEARTLADKLGQRWMYSDQERRERTDRLLDEAIVKRFGEGTTLHYLRGARAVRRAWRITEPGHTKSEEWAQYLRQMNLARTELELAWKADPKNARTAYFMIGVCQGLNLPPAQMEEWFRRALATGQDCSDACDARLDYLGDPVLGSLEDQIAFGHEALAHPEYGWNSSLILWLAHWQHQTWGQLPTDYLAKPEVWRDIKASITAYLARYPEAQAIRLHYAYHAWLVHDWPVFREQLNQVDPAKLDLRLLGGLPAIEDMLADLHRDGPLPAPVVPPTPPAGI